MWVAIAGAVLLSGPVTPVPEATAKKAKCTDVVIAASIAPDAPKDHQIYGRLCLPPGQPPKVLQVLVHGSTYDHAYWDFPGFAGRYSYTRFQNKAGYATLAIDQLGVGRSSHPPGDLVSLRAMATALHDVVTAARTGTLDVQFDSVVLVGHSYGSFTSWLEAGTYQDVDGVLATGASHSIGPVAAEEFYSHSRPAQLDPVTAPNVPARDVGYLSIPGVRPLFYHLPNADPEVIERDEATRSEFPAGGFSDTELYLAATRNIKVPVLEVNGRLDAVFCAQGGGGSSTDCATDATLHDSESPSFSPDAQLETTVVPNAGHSLNLHYNASVFFDRSLRWFQLHFPLK